jgi:hypothetical protein
MVSRSRMVIAAFERAFLTDLIVRRVHNRRKGDRRCDHPKLIVFVTAIRRRNGAFGQAAQGGSNSVQAPDRCEGIIYARGERPHRNFNQLTERELDILGGVRWLPRIIASLTRAASSSVSRSAGQTRTRGCRRSHSARGAAPPAGAGHAGQPHASRLPGLIYWI